MRILELFRTYVQGKQYTKRKRYDGEEGHYVETLMGIKHNAKNAPDIYGYEMKIEGKYKTTLGDYRASEYIFDKTKEFINDYNGLDVDITRSDFYKFFGHYNSRNGCWSWCKPYAPQYHGVWTEYGQVLEFDTDDNLCIYYDYDHDNRDDKEEVIPDMMCKRKIMIAYWSRLKLETHINNKFNKKGSFIIKKTKNIYSEIWFANPYSWLDFTRDFKRHLVFFDGGMNNKPSTKSRLRSNFRVHQKYWEDLAVERFK